MKRSCPELYGAIYLPLSRPDKWRGCHIRPGRVSQLICVEHGALSFIVYRCPFFVHCRCSDGRKSTVNGRRCGKFLHRNPNCASTWDPRKSVWKQRFLAMEKFCEKLSEKQWRLAVVSQLFISVSRLDHFNHSHARTHVYDRLSQASTMDR